MTGDLKDLLQTYGAIVATLSHLRTERPGSDHASLEEYDKSLGPLLSDEPFLVVRISQTGQARFVEYPLRVEGADRGTVTVWELPEDEFWFLHAFRPALFDLNRDLPAFAYQMGLVYAYASFEGYVAGVLRTQFRRHRRLMGSQRKVTYDDVFTAESIEDLLEKLIDREVTELLYLPFAGLLQFMRERLGFRQLTTEYDEGASHLALLRNCLLHNRGKVDAKLAKCRPANQEDDPIVVTLEGVTDAINVLRKLAYQIDRVLDQADQAADPNPVDA